MIPPQLPLRAIALGALASTLVSPGLRAVTPPAPLSGNHSAYVNFTGPDGLVYPDFTWAGIYGGIPADQPVVATVDASRGTDTVDDRQHFIDKINAAVAAGGGVVSIPAGDFYLSDCITITASNIVIRGAGPTLTRIYQTGGTAQPLSTEGQGSDANGANLGLFNFRGVSQGTETTLTANATRGGTTLTVASSSGFTIGDWIRVRMVTPPDAYIGATKTLGGTYAYTLVQITGISGNTLTVNQPHRIDWLSAKDVRIRRMTPIRNCGVEGLRIEALADYGYFHGVRFSTGLGCWTRDLVIHRPCSWPVRFENSKHCVARDSTWSSPWDVGGEGNGYGGLVGAYDSLMENITATDLRHCPNFQDNAQGNVVTGCTILGSDLQWHSGYGLENLVERHVASKGSSAMPYVFWTGQLVSVQHSPAGPRNVIYNSDLSWSGRGIYFGGHNDGWIFAHNRVLSGGSYDYCYMIRFGDFTDNLKIVNNVFAMANNGGLGAVQFIHAWTANETDIGGGVSYTLDPAYTQNRSANIELINNSFYGFPSEKRWITTYGNLAANPGLDQNNTWNATYSPSSPPARPSAPAASLFVWQHLQKFGVAPVAIKPGSGGGSPQVFAWDDFESGGFSGGQGWSGAWSRSGSTANVTDSAPFEGSRHARLLTTGTITRTVDLSAATAPVLHIAWRANSLETGESAHIEINDGSWKTVKTILPAEADNAWNDASYPLSGYNLTSNFLLRLRIQANASNDRCFIDAVEISQ